MARIIQHEYDHIEGKLFIDHINTEAQIAAEKTGAI